MSDHLIAEANRHAMALPKTNPTHADIAWYVREVGELRAEIERLRDGGVQRIKDAMAVVMDERDSFKARAERAEDEVDAQCLLNAKGSEREAVLLRRVDRMAKECLNLRADLDAIKAIRNEETARAAIDAEMKEDGK